MPENFAFPAEKETKDGKSSRPNFVPLCFVEHSEACSPMKGSINLRNLLFNVDEEIVNIISLVWPDVLAEFVACNIGSFNAVYI